jgi:hypothetical protein
MSQSGMDITPVVLHAVTTPLERQTGPCGSIIDSTVAGKKPLRRSKGPQRKQSQMQCGIECAPSVRIQQVCTRQGSSGIVSRWHMRTCASLFGTAMAQHCIVTLPETPCACFRCILHPVQQNASGLCGGRYSLPPQPAWCGHRKKLITFCFDSHAQHDSLDEFDLLLPVGEDIA